MRRMKRMNRFFPLLFAVIIAGCSPNNEDIPTHTDMPLDPTKRYIHFDADVLTRGALVEGDYLQDNFYALGYMYGGDWETEKVMALPNVFNNTPQLVEYNIGNGLFGYTPIQAWTGNKYSFFGYYPIHDSVKLFDDGTVKQGDPYITYELVSRNNPIGLIDVMTASYLDTGVSSNPSVGLHFRHRLAAIDVGARNYYTIEDNNGDDIPVTIELTELGVIFNNLMNDKAKIYLDASIPSVYTPAAEGNRTATYYMVHANPAYVIPKTFDVVPNTSSYTNFQYISTQTGENASTILVIPQEEPLTIGGSITYKKKYKDAQDRWVYLTNDKVGDVYYNTQLFKEELHLTFNKQIMEGRRYFIEFTFTSDAVSVNVIAADEWNTNPDITHEFE